MACITKRKGKWAVDYRIFGKRKVKQFNTKREAEIFHKELLLRPIDGQIGYSPIDVTALADGIERYFSLVTSKKAASANQNEKHYFKKLFKYFGNKAIHEISMNDLEDFQAKLFREVSASTVNRHFNCYRHFFRKCKHWNYIAKNPTTDLSNLRSNPKTKKIWSDQEIYTVLQLAQPWAKACFSFLALTGMRAGEVAKLEWKDVNFAKQFITVTSIKGSGSELKRQIPLVGESLQLIQELYSSRPIGLRNVFKNASNEAVTSSHLSREMRRLCTKGKLKDLTLHGLRHTFITRLVVANESLEKVRMLAGHTNLKTTQQYLHVDVEDLRGSLIRLDSHRDFSKKKKRGK